MWSFPGRYTIDFLRHFLLGDPITELHFHQGSALFRPLSLDEAYGRRSKGIPADMAMCGVNGVSIWFAPAIINARIWTLNGVSICSCNKRQNLTLWMLNQRASMLSQLVPAPWFQQIAPSRDRTSLQFSNPRGWLAPQIFCADFQQKSISHIYEEQYQMAATKKATSTIKDCRCFCLHILFFSSGNLRRLFYPFWLLFIYTLEKNWNK